MKIRGAALVVAVTLILAGSVAGVTADEDRARFGDVLYSYIPIDDNYVDSLLAWQRNGTDLDLFWFFVDSDGVDVPVCSGFSSARNFERCTFGAIGGVEYFLLVSRFEGASTVGWLNVTDGGNAGTLIRGAATGDAGLRRHGSLDAVADDDVVAAARRLKARMTAIKLAARR